MENSKLRSKLKRWISSITSTKEFNMFFNEYRIILIIVFSVALLEKVKNRKKEITNIEMLKQTEAWNYVNVVFNEIIQENADVISLLDEEIVGEMISFAQKYIEEAYEEVDNLLAWVYQYININEQENKFKDTQFFTEQYMVNYLVENSLAKFSNDDLLTKKIIDPACGGGNFLVKVVEEINKREKLTKLEVLDIVKNNIYGYDIDKLLVYVCSINIVIKLIELNIIEELDCLQLRFKIYYDEGNKLGALAKDTEEEILKDIYGNEVEFSQIFAKEYGLVLTNPPFKGNRELDENVRRYIRKEYPNCKGDLCNSFILRSFDLLEQKGIGAYVTQNGWMFLDSATELRRELLERVNVDKIVNLGTDAFIDLNGEKTSVALIIFSIEESTHEQIQLYDLMDLSYKEKDRLMKEKEIDSYEHKIDVKDIKNTTSYRIDYLNKGKLMLAFSSFKPYSEYGVPMQGTSTGDNDRFVKFHWEISDEEWILTSKGGGYCKWGGLNLFKVHWGKDGHIIKSHEKSVIRNEQYFEETELVYSDTGTNGLSVRLLDKEQIFIASGPGIRIKKGSKYNHLAFLNSRIASYFIKTLTPKLTISAKYIGQIPVPEEVIISDNLKELSERCVEYKYLFNKKRPINNEFEHQDYISSNSIYEFIKKDFQEDLELEIRRLEAEKHINESIEAYYNLGNEILIVERKVGKIPYTIDLQRNFKTHQQLDEMIAKAMDENCEIKSKKVSKNSLGVEGVLEFLAVKEGYNPQKTYDYIKDNIEEYTKTLGKYYRYILHKIELMKIGYRFEQNIINEEEIVELIRADMENKKVKIDIERWQERDCYEWHCKAFRNRPLVGVQRGN